MLAQWKDSPQKERHLAAEANVVRRPLPKRKRTHCLEGMRGKRVRSYESEDSCAVQLTSSPVWCTLPPTDTIQLTGSLVRRDGADLGDG